MNDFLKCISGTITRFAMLEDGEPVLAAVSGGADSVCLLLALKELGFLVSAVHVEHGIRGEESLEDCAFVQRLCEREGIRLTVRHIDVPRLASSGGRSLEEAARDGRYKILEETAHSLGIRTVATAHHRGDQAETVLWNLIRGSSLTGLCGILPVREREDTGLRIVRPLLVCGREEIEEWLHERGQTWCTDRTNLDPAITRNAIRLQILPAMERLNAGAARHIAQAAGDLAQTESYLEEETAKAYSKCVRTAHAAPGSEEFTAPGSAVSEFVSSESAVSGSGQAGPQGQPDVNCGGEVRICLDTLRDLPEVIRTRVLRRAVGEAAGGLRDITREHVESLKRLCAMDNGSRICLPSSLLAVREEGIIALRQDRRAGREQGDAYGPCAAQKEPSGGRGFGAGTSVRIRIGHDGEYSPVPGLSVQVHFGVWEGGEVSKKKYTKTLAYDTMFPYITLRTRREGDWIVVNSAGGRRKLKDYLIDEKIPRDRRDEIPLITQGSHVLWVIGHRISEAAKVSEGAHFVRITVAAEQGTEGRSAADRRDL